MFEFKTIGVAAATAMLAQFVFSANALGSDQEEEWVREDGYYEEEYIVEEEYIEEEYYDDGESYPDEGYYADEEFHDDEEYYEDEFDYSDDEYREEDYSDDEDYGGRNEDYDGQQYADEDYSDNEYSEEEYSDDSADSRNDDYEGQQYADEDYSDDRERYADESDRSDEPADDEPVWHFEEDLSDLDPDELDRFMVRVKDLYSATAQNWAAHIRILDTGLDRFSEGIKDEPPPEAPDVLDILLQLAFDIVSSHFFDQLKALDAAATKHAEHLNISDRIKDALPSLKDVRELDSALSGAGGGRVLETAGDFIQAAREAVTDSYINFPVQKEFHDAMRTAYLDADPDGRKELQARVESAYEIVSDNLKTLKSTAGHRLRGAVTRSFWEQWIAMSGGDRPLDAELSCIERGGCFEVWFTTEEFMLLSDEPADLDLADARAYVGEQRTVERQINNLNGEFGFLLADYKVPIRVCLDYTDDDPSAAIRGSALAIVNQARYFLETGSEPSFTNQPMFRPAYRQVPSIYRDRCAWYKPDHKFASTPRDSTSAAILASERYAELWGELASFEGFGLFTNLGTD